jgi:hypothetical protein
MADRQEPLDQISRYVKQNASPITVNGGRREVSQWLCWSAGLLSVLRAGGVAGINDAICF